MNIVFATAEMTPFAKTGGLADVCGSLPAALSKKGHTVTVCIPKYKTADGSRFVFEKVIDELKVRLGVEEHHGAVFKYEDEAGFNVLLFDNKKFFHRDGLYGTPDGDYVDNDRRFFFFQRAILEALPKLGIRPDVLQAHDWQSALLPVYLKTLYRENSWYHQTKAIFTIHNLAYQGSFSPSSFKLTGLPETVYSIQGCEFYGLFNCMKGGLIFSDVITTVSKRYAKEIQLEEFGCGLDGVLREQSNKIAGIINGIDYDEWDPEKDPDITVNYSLSDIDKKVINKGVLQKENSLPIDRTIPLIGMVTRLCDQKGLDIIAPIMDSLAAMNVQVVLLGTGDDKYNRAFKQFGQKYPGHFGMNIRFDPAMAKRIFAGADMFLMPSRFEPCGLGQMVALRYGTVPIVRETGGLADTIIDFNHHTKEGNGFVFAQYSAETLLKTIRKAIEFFQDKLLWNAIIENGRKCDFSWDHSAEEYISLYIKTKRKESTYV